MSATPSGSGLEARLAELGRKLGDREAPHSESLACARRFAEDLRERVSTALDGFHEAAASAGAPHLRIEVSPVRVDDKHLRAVEFNLQRGRHKAVITAKERGDVTLVGPFQIGKTEGPCKSFPMEASSEFDAALAEFLERFVEEAASP
jgi:hypothetical protein